MTSISFWESAWAILQELEDRAPGTADVAVVSDLVQDLTLQRYVFIFRGFEDAAWLLPLREEGLFDEPPPVEAVEGGVRAWGWPALTYLRAVSHSDPLTSADILSTVESDNWWVVADALSVASGLPAEVAKDPVLALLREWERSAVQWTQPETLLRSMQVVAEANDQRALVEALSRVLGRFTDDRTNRYDLSEIVPQIRAELGDAAVTPLADAIEFVLLLRSASGTWRPFAHGLDDLRVDADGLELLVQEWLTSVQSESKSSGGFAALARGVRLLPADTALLRQMGIRALSIALSTEPVEPRAQQVLNFVATREDLTANYEELPELLRLFAEHFRALEPERQAALMQRLTDQAATEERLERLYVRDWLGALRAHLGARERKLLNDLESEVGPPRDSFARPRVEAVWVGPRSALTLNELQTMPVTDLIGHLRHVPIQVDEEWPHHSADPEGFARLLQPLIRDRIDDLSEHLADLARAAESSIVLFYLCWGVRDAFENEASRTGERLPDLQGFIAAAIERAQALQERDDDHERGFSTARALADVLESLGVWLIDAPDQQTLLANLEWLLNSDDPPAVEPEGSEMDPPSRAINSVRGVAVLAALRILSAYWGDDSREHSALADGIEELLAAHIAREDAPAVLSSYGRYLAAIVTYWPSFFASHESQLLPTDPESADRWGAVLGTYVTFYGPHRGTALALRPHFELAIERLGGDDRSYLDGQIERLLMHLVALSLPHGDDADTWIGLMHRALDAAPPEAAARAVHDLAFAVEHDGLVIPDDWTLSLVAKRASSLTARQSISNGAPKRNEATALIELLFAVGVRPSDCIGHLRHLVELGALLDFDDTVQYLTRRDETSSQSGAVILHLVASQESVDGYMPHLDETKELLRRYAVEHIDIAWATVDALGTHAVFAIEDVARELAELRLIEPS